MILTEKVDEAMKALRADAIAYPEGHPRRVREEAAAFHLASLLRWLRDQEADAGRKL